MARRDRIGNPEIKSKTLTGPTKSQQQNCHELHPTPRISYLASRRLTTHHLTIHQSLFTTSQHRPSHQLTNHQTSSCPLKGPAHFPPISNKSTIPFCARLNTKPDSGCPLYPADEPPTTGHGPPTHPPVTSDEPRPRPRVTTDGSRTNPPTTGHGPPTHPPGHERRATTQAPAAS
jgi:hypothetical protein